MSKKERKSNLTKHDQPSLTDVTSLTSKLHITRRSRSCIARTRASSCLLPMTESFVSNVTNVDQRSEDDTSSTDTSIHQAEYIKVQSTSERVDEFFDRIGDLPSINDIVLSSEESLSWTQSITKVTSTTSGADVGRFVDPITGAPISSSSSSVLDVPPTENIEEPVMEEASDLDISDEALLEEPEIEEQDIDKFAEDDLELWIDLQPVRVIHIEDDIDFEAMRRNEELQQLSKVTALFLEELIYRIVEYCEYIDPDVVLRQNLNKQKLMNKLNDLLSQLDSEQKSQQFLNRKVVEYFNRKNMLRPLEVESPDTIMQSHENYNTAMNNLGQLTERENALKTSAEIKKANLHSEVERSEVQFRQNKKQLEDLIKRTLCKDSFTRLPVVVQSELTGISNLRTEISQVRLQLIQAQHDMGRIIDESEKLEYIGEGLSMSNFISLTTETQGFSKKIEERNAELSKLRMHFNYDLLTRTHMREMSSMINAEYSIREEVLRELNEVKKKCRERLYTLKLEKTKLNKASQDLSCSGGLIDKPLLMLDYDKTVARTEKARDRVANLKQKMHEMQNRLELGKKRISHI